MLSAQKTIDPIFIFSLYKNPEKVNDAFLFEKVENLIDIIKARVSSKGIDYTCNSLHNELWELRIEVLPRIKTFGNFASVVQEATTNEIIFSKYLTTELDKTRADCLLFYSTVLSSVISKSNIPQDIEFKVEEINSQKELLKNLLEVYERYGLKDARNLLNYFTSSLNFECALIISFLLKDSIIPPVDNITKEAVLSLKDYIVQFAFNCGVMNLWEPTSDDKTELAQDAKKLLVNYALEKNSVKVPDSTLGELTNYIEDIWKVEAVLGEKFVKERLTNSSFLGKNDLERLFKESKLLFYISNDKSRVFALSYSEFEKKYGPLVEVSALDAFRELGIDILTEVTEKGELKIDAQTDK
jgi:hypothetical protein